MMLKRFRYIFSLVVMAILFVGLVSAAKSKRPYKPPQLTSVHLIDRNGFTETISSKERIKQFQNIDFLKQQPYQKVLRIYERNRCGIAYSVITSYYPNGNLKQYLDVENARAKGTYGEWHPNGMPSLFATVIGGDADITPEAEKSWIFDRSSYVWNEKGDLIAEIQYSKGDLQGTSTYYHSSGYVWKMIPYEQDKIHGEEKIYLESGELFQQTTYSQGIKHGFSQRFWPNRQLAAQEEYRQGRLECGQYFDICGTFVSEISQGYGYRAVFGKKELNELQEYKRGVMEGEVKVFGKNRSIARVFHTKNGLNHGEEIDYYEGTATDAPQPKLSVPWHHGNVHGILKSWYSNGTLESQREMSNNVKNGVLTAWYRDGNFMMIEEYDRDKLVKGDYFTKGEKTPVSQILEGKGVATIYDSEGMFMLKVTYERGKPQD